MHEQMSKFGALVRICMTDSTSPFGTYSLKGFQAFLHRICLKLGRRWVDQRLALALRKVVLTRLSAPIVDACTAGFRIRYYPLDNVSDRLLLFLPQVFDLRELDFMKNHLRADSTFVDIGANAGFYTLFASQYIKTGKILAFEPHPEMAARCLYNVSINRLHQVKVKAYGVADQEKTFSMSVNPTNLGGNSIVLNYQDKPDYLPETIDIPCRPLLNALQEENIQGIDLLKIDIEEAEHLALLPFFQTSPKTLFPKNIIIESDDKIDLTGFGYKKLFSTKSHNSIYTLQ